MLYTMRRTQLYLDDDLWNALHFHAHLNGQTVSELVRKAARDKYMGNPEERRAAMEGIVGLWKERKDIEKADTSIRKIRKKPRLKRRGIK
jgi:hypothetical protein